MERPLISVIVPIFNVDLYLKRCLDSLLIQTYPYLELILVNDGSQDESEKICDDYAKQDNRIKVIHKKNEGVSNARNTGIEASTGNYIMFADPDDYVEKNWCEELVSVIEGESNSLIVSGYYTHNLRAENNVISESGYGRESQIYKTAKKSFYIMYDKFLLNAVWNKIYISKIIKDNSLIFNTNISIGEDLLFNLEYLKHIDGELIIVNKYLYNYHMWDRESLDNRYYINLFEIYKLLFEELENCMDLFGANDILTRRNYFNSYLEMLHRVLDNTFRENSPYTFFEKIKYNNKVIKSAEFKKAYKNASLKGFDTKYLKILNLENYLWIYLLKKFDWYKRKFISNLRFN